MKGRTIAEAGEEARWKLSSEAQSKVKLKKLKWSKYSICASVCCEYNYEMAERQCLLPSEASR